MLDGLPEILAGDRFQSPGRPFGPIRRCSDVHTGENCQDNTVRFTYHIVNRAWYISDVVVVAVMAVVVGVLVVVKLLQHVSRGTNFVLCATYSYHACCVMH